MFNDWPSELIPQNDWGDEFPISAFKDTLPWNVGRDFVAGTAKHLYDGLGLTKPKSSSESKISHDKQLQILMPAIGYGLSFPLTEHDIIKNCVYIYIEWLSALVDPKSCVPAPILKDANHYARIIIKHFYYLFVPRSSEAVDEINRQALLCHRVLRTLQDIAKNSSKLNEETWQTLLLFLLHINSALLSPPAVKNDAGEQLGDRVLSVLFETWLQACSRSFPPPPLWSALRLESKIKLFRNKTFLTIMAESFEGFGTTRDPRTERIGESCQRWRHRPGLIDQWNRINKALTIKLLSFMYGPSFIPKGIREDELSIVPHDMSRDCIAQAWFRILHIIGNPVNLSCQDTISKTPAFLKYAIVSDLVIEPYQHPCLTQLPQIFLSAMKGVSVLVDAFLSETDSIKHHVKGKPKCNSILHLFGPWLFEAAFINCNFHSSSKSDHGSISGSSLGGTSNRRPTSIFLSEGQKTSDASLTSELECPSHLSPLHFQSGRAEALGALCKIFCNKKTGEEILPIYLAKFYLAVREGLLVNDDLSQLITEDSKRNEGPLKLIKHATCSETAASILLNGTNLFCLDLEGIITLVPSIMNVLSIIMLEAHEVAAPSQKLNGKNIPTLRRSATQILLTLLPLPLQFQGLELKELNSNDRMRVSLLRIQLVNLISGALQVETDAINIQMLLAGLVFCVQDATLWEATDDTSLQGIGSEKDLNFQYSASSETMSSADLNSLVSETFDSGDNSFSPVPPAIPRHLINPESAHGLYVRGIYLVSHCLMSSWTKDVNVSLAGLELLSSLALLNFGEQESDECKCAVKWLCDYIVFQCSRPPQAHSKDLHSMIVGAFHCASVWLVAHPYLLQDQECLRMVLEVIELGISGSKSQINNSDLPKYKHEKELKPVSMRVRDAAEALLSCVLSQVGSFPSAFGIESLSSLLDEVSLLKHCNAYRGCDPLSKDAASQHFRYFVIQNSILLALLEQPLGNHEDPQPTVTVIIRGPFGRSAWTMQLRHLPRHKSSAKLYAVNPGRPLPISETGTNYRPKHKYFPDSVERIPTCKADKSIPSLEQVISIEDKAEIDHEKLLQTLNHQIAFEEAIRLKLEKEKLDYPDVEVECAAPLLCQEFQTARLLLSHFGLLSLESLLTSPSSTPQLIALDTSQPGFTKDLECLDNSINRQIDTIHVFYVKAGQSNVEDILSNSKKGDVHPHFKEFLEGLGWPVRVDQHPGWTGHCYNAFGILTKGSSAGAVSDGEKGISYNGREEVLYWADALCELAFVVPTSSFPLEHQLQCSELPSGEIDGSQQTEGECLHSFENEAEGSSLSSHTSQISSGNESRTRRMGRLLSPHSCSNHRVYVAWLESIDDAAAFPKYELSSITTTGLESANWREKEVPIYIIFIHPLASGLFRIKLQGLLNKLSIAGPLVDGQVVSRRVLGTLVRHTALNMCRRKRLENDSYQPPHVRRKFKVQEMVQKYQYEMTESEFYTQLFMSPMD